MGCLEKRAPEALMICEKAYEANKEALDSRKPTLEMGPTYALERQMSILLIA
jgi:hypothetical protein